MALAGYMQGCVTMSVLQHPAGPLQHQGPNCTWLVQMYSQMKCCLVKVVLNVQDFLGQQSQAIQQHGGGLVNHCQVDQRVSVLGNVRECFQLLRAQRPGDGER